MAYSLGSSTDSDLEFSMSELTGALGDSVTVLPLLIALAATTSVSLPHVLVGFGIFQIVWGLYYGMPLSVEPMKALIGLAIVGSLSYPELAAAGLLAGGVLLLVGKLGLVGEIQRLVGEPVIRGVQFAVALLLLEAALDLTVESIPLALAGLAIVGLFALAGHQGTSILLVLGLGGLAAVATAGIPTPRLPDPTLFPAGTPTVSSAALEGTVAQLGMTVGNAAIATALLCSDLYDRNVSADSLSKSMGVTCLAAVPIGGVPMCHGSGGLAGKYAFGARTGGANVILGVGYLALALVATGALLAAFPVAVLGALLVVVSIELARASFAPVDGRQSLAIVLGVGILGLAINVGVAFVLGAIVFWVLARE
ncbi:putative sulfate/molybdate transporter [Natronorubrum daqingense]|uniref:Molybdate transporter of MFS superfamily protein n=1 Tax=Natronorubrum daqingense TaxID=588898 RepID=A0A1N7CLB4_9EURY|nr:putative sulfate/molybdate transporter [Natronorubrum daqingense]APX96957.1 sulfate transporter [Natronorubrum daqingense]SIR64406.1 Molybdate transporter of MFS superfamily protein [Natronorubrum daqingense]